MKLAIVIPWFGRDLKGGAEQHAWQIASRLAQRGYGVEVVTTCCRSHQEDWATNHLAEGTFVEPEGFAIRRFRVEPRDRVAFDLACARLLAIPPLSLRPGVSPVSDHDANIFVDELIKSNELLDFLKTEKESYDHVIFLPYLYGPILRGLPLVGARALLMPCLHNEPYAYLPQVADAFYRAAHLLFISDGEMELAVHLFGPGILLKSVMVGAGVEAGCGIPESNAEARLPAIDFPDRFILYLGRKDTGKNIQLVVNAFKRFRRVRPNSGLWLVLAGPGTLDFSLDNRFVLDLGPVPNDQKDKLLRDCIALFQPSANESFSRVMMEAWMHGKPVAVNSLCLATAVAVRESNGGWTADGEDDWARLLVEIDRVKPAALKVLGENGRNYAERLADWQQVIKRYEKVFTEPAMAATGTRASGQTIHQLLPNLAFGDAISNQALFIRDFLRHEGIESNIYVRHVDARVAHECEIFSLARILPHNSVIYHHSVGTELTSHVIAHQGPKLLIYHNITPAEFFEPYRPDFAEVLRQGRRELQQLARHFPNSAAASAYNAAELRECGFCDPAVLPICIDPAKWNAPADPELMIQLQDGRTNILFVGRIAPNKQQDELVRAFSYYLAFDSTARLILVGAFEPNDPYVAHIRNTIRLLDLDRSVFLPGSTTEAQLAAYYRASHLFWSMSLHEGFGVPLIEAMWFDVPVLARKSSAVPETLGDAAFMFDSTSDLSQVAAAASLLIQDRELRNRIIAAQRKRRQHFLPGHIVTALRLFCLEPLRDIMAA